MVGARLGFRAQSLFSQNGFLTGRGTGIVIATGTATEFGVIFSMMQDVRFCFVPFREGVTFLRLG